MRSEVKSRTPFLTYLLVHSDMRLNIEHHIHCTYPGAVGYTIQQLRLTPPRGFGQRVKHWEIQVNGRMQPYADTYGNLAHTLVVEGLH